MDAQPPAAGPSRKSLEDQVYRASLGEGNRALAGASPWKTVPVTALVLALGAGAAAALGRRGRSGTPAPPTVALVLQEGPDAPARAAAGGPPPAPAPRPGPPAPAPAAAPPPPAPPPAPPDLGRETVPGAAPKELPKEDHSRDYGEAGGAGGLGSGAGGAGTGAGPGGTGAGSGRPDGVPAQAVDVQFSQMRVKYQPPTPEYPQLARNAGIQGTVVAEVTVGLEGEPLQIRVLEGPYPLRAAAVAFLKEFRFYPYLENGVPKYSRFTLHMPFRLKN